ncbi:MAG: TonB-dependent receptor [Chitinophagales bacterium]
MQVKKLWLVSLCILCITIHANAQNSLSGTVTDANDNSPLIGATIYFPDIKTVAVTDLDGYFEISDLPAKTLTVQVTYVGYASATQTIDIREVHSVQFVLKASITEISEVVITGQSHAAEANHTPTPIAIVNNKYLLENSGTNIIDALSKQPGISQIGTGPAISKPVIRGLGYNRVVVVQDGIRQEGQQWGDEHGIEIDEAGVHRVEILKGPASLSYGSDAMAGVIHFISTPTLPQNTIGGSVRTQYQSNNGALMASGDVAGNIHSWIWDARFTGTMAHAYQNAADGYVFNSGYTENAGNITLGRTGSWGYVHVKGSIYRLQPGLVEGERDSITGAFIRPYAINDSTEESIIVSDDDLRSYTLFIPKQDISHYKASANADIYAGDGDIHVTAGYQENNRKEFGDVLDPDAYALYFTLHTITGDLRYDLPEIHGWKISTGWNGMLQTSANLGEEVLIPEYSLQDGGLYAYTSKNIRKWDLAGGMRYDIRKLHAEQFMEDGAVIFSAFGRTYQAFSGSIGATYQCTDKWYSKANISRGFRAPNMAELGSNGVHEGTFRYETGNKDLLPETSMQFDLAFGFSGEHIHFETDLFANSIDHFIFLEKQDAAIMVDDTPFDAFTYAQGNALLYGTEIVLDVHPHPLDWLHFENSFSYVRAQQLHATDSTTDLPFTPGPKWISQLRAEKKAWGDHVANLFASCELESHFAQNHVFTAYATETPTPAYYLLNASVGFDLQHAAKTYLTCILSCNNITDAVYQDHLSRLKYAETNYATGDTGVFGMGRNFAIRLIAPFTLKS